MSQNIVARPLRRSQRLLNRALNNSAPANCAQSTSRLLALPPEIRNLIWEFAVGRNTIHLSCFPGRDRPDIADDEELNLSSFTCKSGFSQTRLYEISIIENPDVEVFKIKSPIAAQYASATNHACDQAHYWCRKPAPASNIKFGLLRVNKQIYDETKLIPYSSNEFIFDEPNAFQAFFRALTPLQKHTLRSIGLSLRCTDTVHQFSECGWNRIHIGFWDVVLERALIQQLTGLQILNIHIQERLLRHNLERGAEMRHLIAGSALQFRELPLKRVNTIVTNREKSKKNLLWNLPIIGHGSGQSSGLANREMRWTLKTRQALAKDVTNALLGKIEFDIPDWEMFQRHFEDMNEREFYQHYCDDEALEF